MVAQSLTSEDRGRDHPLGLGKFENARELFGSDFGQVQPVVNREAYPALDSVTNTTVAGAATTVLGSGSPPTANRMTA